MRPIQLTLTAFGPYHQTEVIDFRQLAPHNLFVISGKTGAGKTTIFDGIAYALYGEPSGTDRKEAVSSLRSDFVTDDQPTTAELIFELRGQRYRIFRQLPYLKRGNKTQTSGKAELYQLNDDALQADLFAETPLVERQIPNMVNPKIEELLGLNRDQFNQLVMLPQGEYQRFLTSKTTEKEAILRTVFNTERYQTVVENLKMSADRAKEEVTKTQARYNSLIQSIHQQLPQRESPFFEHFQEEGEIQINSFQAIAGLEIEAAFYQAKEHSIHKEIVQQEEMISAEQERLVESRSLNAKFQELESAQKHLQSLSAEQFTINSLKHSVNLAEKALSIEKFANDAIRLRREHAETKVELAAAQERFKEAELSHQSAFEKYQLAQGKEELITTLSEEVTLLESRERDIATLNQYQTAISHSQAQITQIQQEINRLTDIIQKKETEKRDYQQRIKNAEASSDPIAQYQQLHSYFQQLSTRLEKQKSEQAALLLLKEEKKRGAIALENAQKAQKEAAARFYQQQALTLMHTLEAGQPCPVCGSLEHPYKTAEAPIDQTDIDVTDGSPINPQDDFEAANQNLITTQRRYDQLIDREKEIDERLQHIAEELQEEWQKITDLRQQESDYIAPLALEIATYELTVSSLIANSQKVESAFIDSQHSLQLLRTLRPQFEAIERDLMQHQTVLEQLKESYQNEKHRLTEMESTLKSILQNIPENLRDTAAYRSYLDQQKTALTTLKTQLKEAEKRIQEVEKERALASQKLEQQQMQQERLSLHLAKAEDEFHKALFQALFIKRADDGTELADEAQFIEAQQQIPHLTVNRAKVAEFERQYLIANEKVNALTEALTGKEPIDLSALEQKVNSNREQLTKLQRSFSENQQLISHIEQTIAGIGKISTALEAARSLHEKTVEVYDLVRGQNSSRISLERFILIEYFEMIIHAANIRLQQMSNGQFQFMRSEDIASRNVQSGLDLNIYDAYTGENRDVKTLSGGEKFKASLSLSLGMADVIQSHKGGVSIDTLFIDEGFGALDEESLLQAIDVLIELQASGRMIGVISHVEELKQTLPARIEVTKTKSGYSKTAIIHHQ